MDRRKFIQGISVAAASCSLSTGLTGCSYARVVPHDLTQNFIRIRKDSFGEDFGVLIQESKLIAPIYVRKHADNDYTATLLYCSHKGCEVRPKQNSLVCPCHGSEFDFDGTLRSAPAEEDLFRFPVLTSNDFIQIQVR